MIKSVQYFCSPVKFGVLKAEKQYTDNFQEVEWGWDSLMHNLLQHESPWALIFVTNKKQTLALQVSLRTIFFHSENLDHKYWSTLQEYVHVSRPLFFFPPQSRLHHLLELLFQNSEIAHTEL